MTDAKRPDRLSTVADQPFDPTSLVGSYFHSEAARGWHGCVVAEPAPGVYLVETFSWLSGSSHSQHLVRIEDMLDWQFYDDAEWMGDAYEHGVATRWEREREPGDRAEPWKREREREPGDRAEP
jgi:hypothetical protein